ncbi:hypothetical protein HAX54_049977, partial [Datura stramonium]|nr:hypothetical protein [Datura stramonium]
VCCKYNRKSVFSPKNAYLRCGGSASSSRIGGTSTDGLDGCVERFLDPGSILVYLGIGGSASLGSSTSKICVLTVRLIEVPEVELSSRQRLRDGTCWVVNVVVGHVSPCVCLLVLCGFDDPSSIIPTCHVYLITPVRVAPGASLASLGWGVTDSPGAIHTSSGWGVTPRHTSAGGFMRRRSVQCRAIAAAPKNLLNIDYPLSKHSRALYKVGLEFEEHFDDDDSTDDE